jgi:hypothetical protein
MSTEAASSSFSEETLEGSGEKNFEKEPEAQTNEDMEVSRRNPNGSHD